ncbi:MAG: serine/threonine-protein kinase, partial [Gemmatimonadota bacterium]|nr:serine/threonine-protein kinase [Gemmatimonadota bacterium]
MDGDRARLDELFWRAADLAGDEREAFLSEACGEDPELRERIEALLAEADLTQDRDGGYLRSLARDLGLADLRSLPEPGEADEPPSRVGTRFGPYRTTKLLGRGGMGSVYQAERVEGDFEQRVAIKVVRRGMETGELSRRLRRERRILARLEHPNIARLFDGGIGEEGQPYLVLEYVEGERITDYCTHHALGLDERLRLFLDVARAVQFAHAKLVVHRDLKPSNVLVTPEGEVKLLDFGISKLLEDDGTEDELTRTGFAVLTPAYAAPEQIRGEEVTTATDVFALGVLLYELLSGRHPFRPNAGTDDRVADRVLEHDPGSPGPEGPVSTPRDLGLVCLNALRKEPERRYGSAADFARDIERCVAGEPVTARPPTLRYRASRFVGRHRVGVAASAAAVMALVVGLGSAVWQAHAAADEAARASRINEFVLDLFRASDPAEALGEDLTARDLLERGARRLERSLEDEPGVRAEMLGVLGPIYRELGLYDEAAPIAETALQLNREVHGEESDETTRALLEVARVARARASLEEADSLFRLVISRYEAEGRAGAGNAAIASGELGELALDRGETESAVELLERAVVQARAELSPGDPDLIWLELTYANALHREERWEEANEIYLSVAEQSATLPGGDDPRVATAVWAYGQQ